MTVQIQNGSVLCVLGSDQSGVRPGTEQATTEAWTMADDLGSRPVLLDVRAERLVRDLHAGVSRRRDWLTVIAIVPTLALLFLLVEDDHLMRAILRDYLLQDPSSRPLLRSVHVPIHLILEPFLVCLRNLLLVDLRVVDEADWTATCLGRRCVLEGTACHLLLFGKFESVR